MNLPEILASADSFLYPLGGIISVGIIISILSKPAELGTDRWNQIFSAYVLSVIMLFVLAPPTNSGWGLAILIPIFYAFGALRLFPLVIAIFLLRDKNWKGKKHRIFLWVLVGLFGGTTLLHLIVK